MSQLFLREEEAAGGDLGPPGAEASAPATSFRTSAHFCLFQERERNTDV